MERLDKVLSNSGYGTRSEVRRLIKIKAVHVDGQVVKDVGMHVDPAINQILISGAPINYRKFIYLMMNKPAGVISATEDKRHETVIDLLAPTYQVFEPFPVGRLDIDTTGLLILTNDGDFAHNLLSPKKHIPKRYHAKLDAPVGLKEIEIFKKGATIDFEYKCLPAELILNAKTVGGAAEPAAGAVEPAAGAVEPAAGAAESDDVDVIIYEGKFHQVKKMFFSVGREVLSLHRLEVGPYRLPDELLPGEYTEFEIEHTGK
ncbi:MAG: pseudouridine synthase [Bacillota bacterium]